MASIELFSYAAIVAGFAISVKLGKAHALGDGAMKFFGSAFVAVVLGVAMSFCAGLLHTLCKGVLCAPTTDTTVWSVAYPIMAAPAYWMAMLVTTLEAKTIQQREDENH